MLFLRGRRCFAPLVLLFLILLVLFPAIGCASEAFYPDVAGHWAENFIRVLWEEEVTEGFPVYLWSYVNGYWDWVRRYNFRPDNSSTRAEFVIMMTKAFRLAPMHEAGPTFRDVPRDLLAYEHKQAYPFIEAAAAEGLVHGDGNGYFHPSQVVTREQAFSLLLRALGLGGHAAGLSDDETEQYLGRFWDRYSVDPSLQKELALAIKLKIVDGYPDGTIRPKSGLTHAEAAAILYRSALFVVNANPEVFSPDDDGYQDRTVFTFRALKNRNLSGWNLYITDYSGGWVKVLNDMSPWSGWVETLPSFLEWNGRNDSGILLLPGTYYYYGWIRDRNGQVFYSVRKPLQIREYRLWASLSPSSVSPGGNLHLQAITSGRASRVKAYLSGDLERSLVPRGPTTDEVNSWETTLQIPEDWGEGEKTAVLEANFGEVTRRVRLPFQVRNPAGKKRSPQPGKEQGDPRENLYFTLSD
ncbi:MAG: S-layer homology domain-containing protein [Firmicutes bacterium]|nr:S-layer homology domain-containing protein [Bacillota bacterium]